MMELKPGSNKSTEYSILFGTVDMGEKWYIRYNNELYEISAAISTYIIRSGEAATMNEEVSTCLDLSLVIG